MSRDPLVVTGPGVVSSVGIGVEDFWKSRASGASGAARISAFDPAGGFDYTPRNRLSQDPAVRGLQLVRVRLAELLVALRAGLAIILGLLQWRPATP